MTSLGIVSRSPYFSEAYAVLGSRLNLAVGIEKVLAVHGRMEFRTGRMKEDKPWYQWIIKTDLLRRGNETVNSFLENVSKVDQIAAQYFIACYSGECNVLDLFVLQPGLFKSSIEERWLRELFERNGDLKATLGDGNRELLLTAARQATTHVEFYFLYLYGKETLNQVSSVSLKECIDSWQNHVVHDNYFIVSAEYGIENQQRYGAMMERSIREAVAFLDDFYKLLDYLAYCRHRMGCELSKEDCFGFPIGWMQSDLPQYEGRSFYPTYCNSSYRELGNFFESIAPTWLKEKPEFFREAGPEDEDATYQMWVGDIPHSALRMKPDKVTIIHTRDPAVRKRMLQKAKELFQNPDLESLGQVYWWICQAKPWNRGDPSIAEMLIKTKLYKQGSLIRPWKQGLIPWVEVMKEPDPVAFGRKFKELLQA